MPPTRPQLRETTPHVFCELLKQATFILPPWHIELCELVAVDRSFLDSFLLFPRLFPGLGASLPLFPLPAIATGRTATVMTHPGQRVPGCALPPPTEDEQPGKGEHQTESEAKEQEKPGHGRIIHRNRRSGCWPIPPRGCRAWPAPPWSSVAARTYNS